MKERLKEVPLAPGVYLYKDKEAQVIYVGKAKALRNRMRSYFAAPERLDPKVRALMARVQDFDFIVTSSELEALILENNLIKTYKPRYNIDLRDDKTYPYLKVTLSEKYPRLLLVREKKDASSRYFGPYTDVTSLRATMKLLAEVFSLRNCKTFRLKQRACLNFDIGRCMGPCVNAVSNEEYGQKVQELIGFLEGNYEEILKKMQADMQTAAQAMNFEKAARLRDQINNIGQIISRQGVAYDKPFDMDVIVLRVEGEHALTVLFRIRAGKIVGKENIWLNRSVNENEAELMAFFLKRYFDEREDIPLEILVNVYPDEAELITKWLKLKSGHKIELKIPQRGEKKSILDLVIKNAGLLLEERLAKETENQKILVQLSKVLDLEVVPYRIEGYDISHLTGEETVASMAVFTDGKADPSSYRRFKVKNDQNNDFASLAETIKRRFSPENRIKPSFQPEPDLIVIDGGLGQVNAVAEVLRELHIDIPLISLAKKEELVFKPGCAQPITLSRRDEALKLLQRLRDESHRFALAYNRQRRQKKARKSALDEMPGVGPQRKQALLAYFGSVEKLKKASIDEIAEVKGISRTIAQQINSYFNRPGP